MVFFSFLAHRTNARMVRALTIECTGRPTSGLCQPITDGHLSTRSAIPSCCPHLLKRISGTTKRTNAAAVVSLVRLACQQRLRTALSSAIADRRRSQSVQKSTLGTGRSTRIYALGDRPEARHVEGGGPKNRAKRSLKIRMPSQAEFHPRGLCAVARRPNRKSGLKRYQQPGP